MNCSCSITSPGVSLGNPQLYLAYEIESVDDVIQSDIVAKGIDDRNCFVF